MVRKIPDHTAVVYKDKTYTYKELDDISDRLGRYIASMGIGREDVVSILIPRCEVYGNRTDGCDKKPAQRISRWTRHIRKTA